ncbi:MAG: peroxiredoxin-like family protein [Lutibacter sp.]|uniref:peroxiredoxin-like family protein n=1 Tax=Lutibacter sp. TaxID=1925666 RepID=UPI00299F2B26|nr:peroxiredoxin-like family protein [Lutibacter sp.]MDX1829831.1 peroxiredoxin-like family protein [Lutibacter sp.]
MIMRITLLTLFQFLFIGKVTSQINNEHLKIGEIAPKISGIDQFGNKINSDEILEKNQILLIFYRGNWCPYCNKHLKSLEENLQNLQAKNIKVLLVSPEKQAKINETSVKFHNSFSIIYDSDDIIMNNYKVAFNVTKENVPKYFEFTLKKVMEYNEKENFVLPVPATYLIGKDKKIKYVQYDPDYKNRSNIEEILTHLN